MLGLFVDSIEYVLIVATPIEINVLGVSFPTSSPHPLRGSLPRNPSGAFNRGPLSLFATQISVPTDNVTMTQILGLDNSRIFMTGNNGIVYELQYQVCSH